MSPLNAFKQRQTRLKKMNNSRLIITLLLISTTTLVTLNDGNYGGALVQCSSSYIYDHILPTAKVALNKIRGSFTPSLQDDQVASTPESSVVQSASSEPSVTTTTTEERVVPPEWMREAPAAAPTAVEPKKDEFVNLDVRGEPASPRGESTFDVSPTERQKEQQTRDEQQATVVSASESVSEDPTTAFSVSQSNESEPNSVTDQNPQTETQPPTTSDQTERAKVDDEPQTTTPASTTTTERQQPAASDPSELGVIETNQIGEGNVKSAAEIEAIRTTELEAVAAVDASMSFGDSFANPESTDACYDEYGNARYCEPEFENVALERQVDASSECGHPPSRFCTTYLNEHNDQIRNCHICDAQHPKKRHPSSYLTDANVNSNNPTCWVSAPISAQQQVASSPANNSLASEGGGGQSTQQRDNVTLTLNLDKKYEITYISMQFCSLKPDSLAIWRSTDFGQTWSPYQFYSSQCERIYERPTAATTSGPRQESFEASCLNTTGPGWSAAAGRIAFSTLDAVRANNNNSSQQQQVDRTSPLQEWTTATNIRIVLDRHQASWIQSSLAHHPHHRASRLAASQSTSSLQNGESNSKQTMMSNNNNASDNQQQQLETSLTNPSDTYNYALSDLTVGGRCKCNGHASRCIHNADGKLQCDCQHNTDGPDCERCLPLHHDRPWQPATQANANPCQPCNCNGHSRKCRFDAELYLLSGKRSGGVCIDCKDNTTGRHCHWCKEGHTRDHSKPMSDKGACKPCYCHPVGSVGKVCNQTTGQCPCKEGVTGLECNRCAPGYQQSSSPSEPCIRLPENDINYEPTIELDNEHLVNSVQVSHQSSGDQEPSLLVPADQESAVTMKVVDQITSTRAPPVADSTPKKADQDDLASSYNKDDDANMPRIPSVYRQHQAHPHRRYEHQQWRQYQQQFGDNKNRMSSTFYRNRNRPHQQFADASDDYPDESTKDQPMSPPMMRSHPQPLDDPLDDYQINPRHQLYGTPSQVAATTDGDYYQDKRHGPTSYGGSSGFIQNPRGRPSIASLDPGDGQGGGDDNYDQVDPYGQQEPSMGAIYPPVDDDFNHISTGNLPPTHRRRQQQHAGLPARNHNDGRNRHLNRKLVGSSMTLGEASDNRRIAIQQAILRAASSVTCAECQSATKKMSFKQFCHLEYAIRATVFDKQIDVDWTRFDVEIKDIFKSPTSSSLMQVASQALNQRENKILPNAKRAALAKSRAMIWESGYLADDPDTLMAQNQNQTQGMSTNNPQIVSAPEQQHQHPIHRLKIGSIQSIWIPTEDVTCKCPRLKLGASYLLMGLVDTKENSATSIQLDRHGVALEWKASLQEKLMKYQRRHSRGKC